MDAENINDFSRDKIFTHPFEHLLIRHDCIPISSFFLLPLLHELSEEGRNGITETITVSVEIIGD